MFQLLFLALLPFVLCEEGYFKPEAPVGRYEDMEPMTQTMFKVQELTRTTVYGLWQFRLFQTDDDTYITTSHFDNKETHTGDFPVLKWNDDEEVFVNDDVAIFPQVDGNTRIRGSSATTGSSTSGLYNQYATDFLSLTYPFQTMDGTWWAYDTVGLVEDDRLRYRNEISWTGETYMRSWDVDNEVWSDPAFTWRVDGAGWRHYYFVGDDAREYVWTYNFGNDTRVPAWAQGVSQCWLLEYTSGASTDPWTVVTYGTGTTNDAFPACPQLPRAPVVFNNTVGEWTYLATSQGTPSCPSGTASCTVNKAVAPATWWTTTNNGRDSYRNFWNVSDHMDAFNIPACQEAKHWVYDDTDYIIALTESGIATYRLWWNTHEVEELPFLSIAQPDIRFLDFFTAGHRECILVSSSYLNTYPSTPVPGTEDSWTNMYCWDPTHDNWDFAGAIPSEGTLWATQFAVDGRQYIVRVEEGHHQTKNVHVYRIHIEDDQDRDIYYDEWNPSNDNIYKRVDRSADKVHKGLAVGITSLSLLIIIFVFVLLMLYVSTSNGGGGGSTDYRGM